MMTSAILSRILNLVHSSYAQCERREYNYVMSNAEETTCKKCPKPLTEQEIAQGGICTACIFGRL